VSTDYVFDGDHGPYGLDDVPNPRGVYATTKHAGEQAVRTLGGSWAIARAAVVYGWPAAGRSNFGAWLVSNFEQKKGVKLFHDQFVSPSLALSVAAMLAELAERRLPGLWHTSGAAVVDRVAFGRALCEVFGFDPALITPTALADLKLASPRPRRCGLKVEQTAAALKAQPLGLSDALKQFHAEYRGLNR
jgi:dTDP-4-dehydrorhamnose reductase